MILRLREISLPAILAAVTGLLSVLSEPKLALAVYSAVFDGKDTHPVSAP